MLAEWQAGQRRRLDWVRPEAGAMCCMRLRADAVDHAAVTRFWERVPANDMQLGPGPWFGESPRVFRLGFGYLPLPDLRLALDRLALTLDQVSG